MISALLQADLASEPTMRTASNGTAYCTTSLRVPAGAEVLFVSVAAFDERAAARLMKLTKGSPVCVVGTLELSEWQSREGEPRKSWRLLCTEALSLHQARKKREAAAEVADAE